MMEARSGYLLLLSNHYRSLAFGFLMAFASSAGQTYLVGVFGPGIQQSFGLTHTAWGVIYMAGTLASSAVIIWSGALIDRIPLRSYVAIALSGLLIACIVMSAASTIWMVVIAVFLLRQFGQGLTSHASVTTMARRFGANRGKAIALASMGYSAAESILPLLAVLAISAWGWRSSYLAVALGVVILMPILLWLPTANLSRLTEAGGSEQGAGKPDSGQRSRRQVLGETRFWLMMPGCLAPSLIMTALFFHHLNLADAKAWSGEWVTGSYWLYALATVLTSFAAGPLVDRLSAARVVPFMLLPLALGLLALVWGDSKLWVLPYMFMMGVTTAIFFTGLSALWAELYGVRHLGAIKAMIGALGVFASALGPALVGVLLDGGFTMEAICLGFAIACVLSGGLLVLALGMKPLYPGESGEQLDTAGT